MLDSVTVPVKRDPEPEITRIIPLEPNADPSGGRGRLALAHRMNDDGPFPSVRLRADVLQTQTPRRNPTYGDGYFREAWLENGSGITDRSATVERLLNALYTLLNSAPNDFVGMRLRLEVSRFMGDFLLDGQKNERGITSVTHMRSMRPTLRLSLLSMIDNTLGKGPA